MAHTHSPLATTDDGEESTEHPDVEYVHELPDAERERRMSPWGYDSWDDIDPKAVECKRYPGSTEGSLACHARDCPGEELVELLGQPVDFEPGHPGDFCEVYECLGCGRTGKPLQNDWTPTVWKPRRSRRARMSRLTRCLFA